MLFSRFSVLSLTSYLHHLDILTIFMTRPLIPDTQREWTKGDFTLVATDGVEFKVSWNLLLSVSGVFSDAECLAGDARRELYFVDPDFETSPVISRFLQLASTHSIGQNGVLLNDDDLEAYIRLVAFLRKYDCPDLLALLPPCIRGRLEHDEISPQHVYIIGAVLDDVELCVSALKRRTAGAVQDGSLVTIGAHTIVVSDIPQRFRRFIPEEYWFGLIGARRSLDSRSLIPTKRNEWDDISVDFRLELSRLKRSAV